MPIVDSSSILVDQQLLHRKLRPRLDRTSLGIVGNQILNVVLVTYLATNGGIHVPLGNQTLLNLIDHQMAALFWIGAVWLFVRNGTRIHLQLWSCRIAFLFLAYTILSIFWGDTPLRITWYPAITSMCTFLYYNYLLDRYTLYGAVRMMIWPLATLLFLCLFAEVLASGYALDDGSRDPNNLGALQGVFNQKNILAMVATLGFAVGLGFNPRTMVDRGWQAILVILSIFCAWQSQSREGWIAMTSVAALALLLALMSRVRRRFRLPFVLAGLGSLLFGCLLLYNYLDDLLRLLNRTRDASGRTEIWSSVFLMITRRPWFGYGMWGVWETPRAWDAVVRTGWSITSAHNDFLEIILGYGYVGFTLYIIMLLCSIYFMIQGLLADDIRDGRVLIYLMVSILILSFAVSLTMFSPSLGMILLLFSTSHLEMLKRPGFVHLRTSGDIA